MNYETAKALKDAGFPQEIKIGGWFYHNFQMMQWCDPTHYKIKHDDICIPTLDSLIEECGDEFASLTKNSSEWLAQSYGIEISPGIGSTSFEAIAKLYLALHKKI